MNKAVIFDIDNVLADFEGRLVEDVLMPKYGYGTATQNRDKYNFAERWQGEVLADALDFVRDPNSYYGLKPIQPMVEFAQVCERDEGLVLYVSARPTLSLYYTKRWLKKNGLLSNENLHSVFVGVEDKAAFLADLEYSVDFVVEDSPDTIRALKDNFTVLCFDTPWNKGLFPRIYVSPSNVLMYHAYKTERAEPLFEALAETEE